LWFFFFFVFPPQFCDVVTRNQTGDWSTRRFSHIWLP
jgi:hypothetical protein